MNRRDVLKAGLSLALVPLGIDILPNKTPTNTQVDISHKKYHSPFFRELGTAKNIYIIRESKLGTDRRPSNTNCYRHLSIQYERGYEEWTGFCAGQSILNKFDIDGFFQNARIINGIVPKVNLNNVIYEMNSVEFFIPIERGKLFAL